MGMIDVNRVMNTNRSDAELLEFWLFCLFVRGKNADIQVYKLHQFMEVFGGIDSFLRDRASHSDIEIESALRRVKAGQYDSLRNAICATLDNMTVFGDEFLRTASLEDLENIPGVGPKTARYFLMNTRADQRYAALDTHILHFLEAREGIPVPKTTPTGQRYRELEEIFLLIADFEDVSPVALDIAVWRASREDNNPLGWHRYKEIA